MRNLTKWASPMDVPCSEVLLYIRFHYALESGYGNPDMGCRGSSRKPQMTEVCVSEYCTSRMLYTALASLFQLDCGIHPGKTGMEALPYVDMVDADTIDLLLISQ